MGVTIAPTKSNLIKAKSSLELCSKGFELLDKKRNVLIKEMMSLVDDAREIQQTMGSVLEDAYRHLEDANITTGIKDVTHIARSVPKDEQYEILIKSVMGVEIPSIKYQQSERVPTYGFHNTNTALDAAIEKFKAVKYMIYRLAEIDSSIFRLAKEIQKTQKRTNALEHIQIPRYKEQVKYIQDSLEEKEREDFFRLKRMKEKQKNIP